VIGADGKLIITLHAPPCPWAVATHPRPAPQSAFVLQVAVTHWPKTKLHQQIEPASQSESWRHPEKHPE
jgi:hypothetical protein